MGKKAGGGGGGGKAAATLPNKLLMAQGYDEIMLSLLALFLHAKAFTLLRVRACRNSNHSIHANT